MSKADRCEAVWFGRECCERDAGHDGPHMTGLALGMNLLRVWANVEASWQIKGPCWRRQHMERVRT